MCEQSLRLAGCLKRGAVSSSGVLYSGPDSLASWRNPWPREGVWQCPRPRGAGRGCSCFALLGVSAMVRATQPQRAVSHSRAGELRTVGSLETPGKQQNIGHGGLKPLWGASLLPVCLSVPGLGPNRSLVQAALQTLQCKGSVRTHLCLECVSTMGVIAFLAGCMRVQAGPRTPILCIYAPFAYLDSVPQCCQSLRWCSFSRKRCSQGNWMPVGFELGISL